MLKKKKELLRIALVFQMMFLIVIWRTESSTIIFHSPVILFYHFRLVSAVQQCGSPTCIHISPSFWASLQTPIPPHLGHHRALSWAPCTIQQLVTSYFNHYSVYMPILFSQLIPHFPSPAVSTSPFFMSPIYTFQNVSFGKICET